MTSRSRNQWQPEPGQWLVFRMDTQVQNDPIDIYVMIQIPTLYAYGYFFVQGDRPTQKEIKELLQAGFEKDKKWARRLTVPKGDPAEALFQKLAELRGITVETRPSSDLEPYAAPMKEGWAKQAFSPSGMLGRSFKDDATDDEKESARVGIPDSYDPCPCNSGKKYKFCCKRIFREIILAMTAAQEGRTQEALELMRKAQAISGESAEVLCRYGIVYSHFDRKKAEEYFEKCGRLFPTYPRIHYIRGIELKEKGELEKALIAYKKAIECYVPTDKYHLNEVWNNVGTIHYDLKQYEEAKSAWEKALVYLPSDRVVKQNLIEFIYSNSNLPDNLKKPSPFVERFMASRYDHRTGRKDNDL